MVTSVTEYSLFINNFRRCGKKSSRIRLISVSYTHLLFAHTEELMVQEYLEGQEIGADVYIDTISKEVVSIFTKKKLLMRSGETDKAVSFIDDKLFSLIERFVKELSLINI